MIRTAVAVTLCCLLGCGSSGRKPDAHEAGAAGGDGGSVDDATSDETSDAPVTSDDASDAAVDADAAETSGDASGERADAGDPTKQETPPWRDLNVTVAPGQHVHSGLPAIHSAGVDNRAKKLAGKLIIDLSLFGSGYQSFFGKRGFHMMGVTLPEQACAPPDGTEAGRDINGDCSLNILDGIPHGDQRAVTPAHSVMSQVLEGLKLLEAQFPGEGWGFFLTRESDAVRWSDVAFVGNGAGGTLAAVFGQALFLYRVVSVQAPRGNLCGTGASLVEFDPQHPPVDPNCPLSKISRWLDAPTVTPIDRYYAFNDNLFGRSFGEELFAMERLGYVGMPVNVDMTSAPYGGSHRLHRNVGQVGWPMSFPAAAIDLAFGVAPENANPAF